MKEVNKGRADGVDEEVQESTAMGETTGTHDVKDSKQQLRNVFFEHVIRVTDFADKVDDLPARDNRLKQMTANELKGVMIETASTYIEEHFGQPGNIITALIGYWASGSTEVFRGAHKEQLEILEKDIDERGFEEAWSRNQGRFIGEHTVAGSQTDRQTHDTSSVERKELWNGGITDGKAWIERTRRRYTLAGGKMHEVALSLYATVVAFHLELVLAEERIRVIEPILERRFNAPNYTESFTGDPAWVTDMEAVKNGTPDKQQRSKTEHIWRTRPRSSSARYGGHADGAAKMNQASETMTAVRKEAERDEESIRADGAGGDHEGSRSSGQRTRTWIREIVDVLFDLQQGAGMFPYGATAAGVTRRCDRRAREGYNTQEARKATEAEHPQVDEGSASPVAVNISTSPIHLTTVCGDSQAAGGAVSESQGASPTPDSCCSVA